MVNSKRLNRAFFAWTLIAASSALPLLARADITIYVSPAGNDAWSGSAAEPNGNHTDGPLATPARARDVARTQRTAHEGQTIRIVLRGGTYFLEEPLTLGPEDSGSAQAPIIWSAATGESPILSAGRRLSAWQKTTVNGRDAWKASLGPDSYLFRELWVNGARMTRSRWPKKGTCAVGESSKARTHAEWRHSESQFAFKEGDVQNWPTATDGEVLLMSRWVEARMPIESIDLEKHLIHCTKKSGFHAETGDRYAIENVKENLTDPGEWYLDPREKAVYLIPPVGVSSPDRAEVIAPELSQIMRLAADPAGKRLIEHVEFHGLTFANNEWYFDHLVPGQKPDPTRSSYNQAAIGIPGAVWCQGVCNCVFDHCTIANVGSYGIDLGRGCQHNLITHCTLTDLAAGGVKIGEPTIRDRLEDQNFDNRLLDSRITNGGNLFPDAVGVYIGQSHDNSVAHNEIAHLWYSGISVGWTWGYGKALSQRNLIEANEVHHIGMPYDGDQPVLSDMGAIYTLGDETGTIIRGNRFHDIAGVKYGGWGIYFDEGTTGILAENNLVYRTTHGGFHQHYGKENVVRNNIFAFGRDAQIRRSKVEDHVSFTFENNLVYWTTGALLDGHWEKLNVIFDHNTYCHVGAGAVMFAKLSWAQWRQAGLDVHSAFKRIEFKDPENADFHLSANSEEELAGFVPFDLSGVGPRN